MEKPIENEYNKKGKDKDNDKLVKMWERISKSIKRYYPSNIKKIPSLGSIAKEYKMHRNTVRKYIIINLEKENGQDSAYHIFSEIWYKNLKMIQNRYSKFLRIQIVIILLLMSFIIKKEEIGLRMIYLFKIKLY